MSGGPTPRELTAMALIKGIIVGAVSGQIEHLQEAGLRVESIHVEGPEEEPIVVVTMASGRYEIHIAPML